MKIHWTAQSVKDYLFRIASDFIAQLQNKMESLPISQDELAKKLGITKGAVSQWINHPGNVSLGKMIEYAKAVGMKLSVVAYEDDDPDNRKGPIDSEIFRICWEQLGKPRDFWDVQGVVNTGVHTYSHETPYHFGTFYVGNVPGRIYDAKMLYGWEGLSANFATCQTYFPVKHSAGNNSFFKKDEQFPS